MKKICPNCGRIGDYRYYKRIGEAAFFHAYSGAFVTDACDIPNVKNVKLDPKKPAK